MSITQQPTQKNMEELNGESIKKALKMMLVWNGKTWETWEGYKDRNSISETSHHGDLHNGGTVFHEKYTEYFANTLALAFVVEINRAKTEIVEAVEKAPLYHDFECLANTDFCKCNAQNTKEGCVDAARCAAHTVRVCPKPVARQAYLAMSDPQSRIQQAEQEIIDAALTLVEPKKP